MSVVGSEQTSQNKHVDPQSAQWPLLLAALVPVLGILYLYPFRFISVLGFLPQDAPYPERDICWAEMVVHPVLLWHPFPRRVLIAGNGSKALVKESLRHIATTPIHWVDSTSPDIPKDTDILSRVIRHPKHSVDSFISENFTFDAVILDRVPSPSLVLGAAERMAPGGVLAFVLPDKWEDLLMQALVAFKHVHLFTPYDSAGRPQYYAIATNSDAYPPPIHLSATYVNTLVGRRIVHKSLLQHYDGESHLRMFFLQRQIRLQLIEMYSSFTNRPSTSSSPNLAPFLHESDSTGDVYPKIISLSRDFVLCGRPPLSEAEATQMVLNSLTNGEGILRSVVSHSWNTYQNVSTYAVPSGLDFATVKFNPDLDNSTPHPSSPAQIIVNAIFDGGSLSLHVLPHLGLSRVSIVNSNGWVSSEDILDTLGDAQHCERSSGVTHSGPAPLIHSNTLDERLSHFGDDALGSVHHWKLDSPYWSSPKIDVRKSLLAGSGNWANAEILKDEVIFRGPVESEAIHIEEYKRYPAWKKSHIDHFGERPHEEILSGPSKGLEDAIYFLNHACSPNIRYSDSYDVMVAAQNISIGEELTFDYATSCGPGIRLEQCKCGAKNCRQKVTGSDWKDENLVESLGKEAFIPYLKAKIVRTEEGIQT